jgi:hypothetical protein
LNKASIYDKVNRKVLKNFRDKEVIMETVRSLWLGLMGIFAGLGDVLTGWITDFRKGDAKLLVDISDADEIGKLIHYGKDFLWLDRVKIFNNFAIGYLNVTEDRCRGHLDVTQGYPLIFPRVLMEEMAGQTGASYLAFHRKDPRRIPVFSGKSRCWIGNSVFPGDVIEMKVRSSWMGRLVAKGNNAGEQIFWLKASYEFVPARLFRMAVKKRKLAKAA